MEVYRCRICGEPFVGDSIPSHCPMCGAPGRWMVDAKKWIDESEGVVLTGVSRKNLEKTLQLEADDTEFYLCASRITKDPEVSGLFKSISRNEKEHMDVVMKLLKVQRQAPSNPGFCHTRVEDNFKDSNIRESNAVKLYLDFAKQATELRVKQVFTALSEIEKIHLGLSKGRFKLSLGI